MTIHTVERGDSIYSIARMYGVPQSRVITDNMLENPSRLVVGEDIVILYPTETYTVRGGDTLVYDMNVVKNRGALWVFEGKAFVDDTLVAEAQLKAMIMDR